MSDIDALRVELDEATCAVEIAYAVTDQESIPPTTIVNLLNCEVNNAVSRLVNGIKDRTTDALRMLKSIDSSEIGDTAAKSFGKNKRINDEEKAAAIRYCRAKAALYLCERINKIMASTAVQAQATSGTEPGSKPEATAD